MKICFTIAEYNPFHLGHAKHVDYMRNVLGADKIVVLMSGNFTQRGEPAVLNKFKRAEHAIKAGVDAVIELPTIFATSNAETFAKGAISVISSLGVEGSLCFGIESGEKQEYLDLAFELKTVSQKLNEIEQLIKNKKKPN
jgi:predicted nucleotidyltransferase